MTDATLAELDVKIAEHRDQLAQVNELLASVPGDESLLKLQADINQVLAVTYELRRAKTNAAATPTAQAAVQPPPLPVASSAAAAADVSSSAAVPPPLPSASASASSAASYTSAAAAGTSALAALASSSLSGSSTNGSSSGNGSAVGVPVGEGGRRWAVKERCMAQWTDGKYYSARIDGISELNTYRITFLDYGNAHEVTYAQLQPFLHAPASLLKPGVLVRAVWPEDGRFYDAKIEGLGSAIGLFALKFTKYKTATEAPVSDIVIRRFSAGDAEGKAEAAAAAFAPTASASSDAAQTQAFAATGGLTEDEVKQLIARTAAREAAESAAAAAAAASGAGLGTAITAKRVAPTLLGVELGDRAQIPADLLPLPTDSEQVKAMKLKKIKRLKNKHRTAVRDQAGEIKQNAWQKFTAKAERVSTTAAAPTSSSAAAAGTSTGIGAAPGSMVSSSSSSSMAARAMSGAEKQIAKNKTALEALKVLGKKRKSIFASPDSIDGRVGVTGSGRNMTEYRDLGRAKFSGGAPTPTTHIPRPGE